MLKKKKVRGRSSLTADHTTNTTVQTAIAYGLAANELHKTTLIVWYKWEK